MRKPMLTIVAALAESNRVIGRQGKLPWHIPEDLQRFKQLTVGHAVIMGRNTFESILARNGRPLPDRRNVVLTATKTYADLPAVATYASLETALADLASVPEVFVIGGEKAFTEALLIADRLELTIVEDEYEGDAFFPEFEYLIGGRFRLINKDERDGFRFESYELVR